MDLIKFISKSTSGNFYKYYLGLMVLSLLLTACKNHSDDARPSVKLLPQTSNSLSVNNTKATSNKYSLLFNDNVVPQVGRAINCILQDKRNDFWFGSNAEGVFYYDGKSILQFTTKDGLSDNQIMSLHLESNGDLWIVTAGGIDRFDGKHFTSISPKEYNVITEDLNLKLKQQDLWFERGGGAFYYSANKVSYLKLPSPNKTCKHENTTNPQNPDARKLNGYSIYTSFKDKANNIWFGTQTLGVCKYDGEKCTWYDTEGLAGPAVRAIFQDSRGTFWFGNNGNGLYRYDGKILTNFTKEKGLDNPKFITEGKSKPGTLARVWSINEDINGNLWIATCDTGVWRYDGEEFINYTKKDGLTSDAVNIIFKDNKGQLWFGTDGAGVCRYDGRLFMRGL